MSDKIETVIIYSLLSNEKYAKKVLPFLQSEYFSEKTERVIFDSIKDFVDVYASLPAKEAILISINGNHKIKDEVYNDAIEYFSTKFEGLATTYDEKWLLNTTESWCQEKALYGAMMESISIIDDKDSKKPKTSIPEILTDALSVGFNTNIGHDYIDDSDSRFDFYHRKEEKIAFDIKMLNKITDGGLSKKSLNIFVAGTNVGKSLALCHFAASYLNQGKNVLYITLEMAEERIAERIDANLLDVAVNDLRSLPKSTYDTKISKIRSSGVGKLIIKEYPTASAHVGHFTALINDLRLKKNFMPDVLLVDYINIMSSSRIKISTSSVNSYTYVKCISEELRGLSMSVAIPVITATQLNRTGQSSSSVDFSDISESHGLSCTADLLVAIIRTEELDDMHQILFQQLKNRYSDAATIKRFVVGIDRCKMRLYDIEQPLKNIQGNKKVKTEEDDDVSGFDRGKFGQGMKAERRDFSKIKVD